MHRLHKTISSLLLLLAPIISNATESHCLDTDPARVSYSAGHQAVAGLLRAGREPDLAALLRGALDALDGTALLSEEEMRALLQTTQREQTAQGVRDELTPIGAAEAFLAANAKKPGVTTLPSGLQYRVLHAGSGKRPRLTDSVVVHYRGSRVDGTEFDSTYTDDAPETYRVDAVMPGWKEALQLMREGAEWELYIPSRLAYGKRGPLENQALIYRIRLLSVIAPETTAETPQTDTAPR
jgi:FKBP-type peptidyl-prolyl cis-trans isomerase FklB